MVAELATIRGVARILANSATVNPTDICSTHLKEDFWDCAACQIRVYYPATNAPLKTPTKIAQNRK